MKKTICFLLMLSILMSSSVVPAIAVGDGNIDSGGGGMGTGSSYNYWDNGNEGVRVTIVKADTYQPVTTPIDLTNRPPSASIYHFGKISKISYNSGKDISPQQGGYTCITASQSIPTIISSSGNNIEAIKSYFTDEQVLRSIASNSGMDYDVLINGNYKLLLEPFAFYMFQGVMISTTATEAALYDEVLSGQLRKTMGSLTHKNLPLAMFLEVGDLGYPAWSGSRKTHATNADIKSSLGLGIVRFTEEPEPPIVFEYDYEYRTDTEVITSVYVSGGQSDPDNPTTVTFDILGTDYTVGNIYYPEGDGQLAWVKWTTPLEPQEFEIDVSVDGTGHVSKATINVKIVDLDKNPPPNPVADDRNDDFEYADIPQRAEQDKLEWTVWDPWWQEYWVDRGRWKSSSWTDSEGNRHSSSYWSSKWVDEGWWEFDLDRYYATLDAEMELVNDPKNPTATSTSLKSGYGVNIHVESKVASNQSTAVSKTPNAVSYFPEFAYDTYWRLLERTKTGSSSTLEFQENVYSTYRNRTHFTPIWMPDGPYEVNTWLIDYWTPAGMLSANLSDSLTIKGNLWQDWHVAVKDPN